MPLNEQKLSSAVGQALRLARDLLLTLKTGDEVVKQGGAFGDLKNDTEIAADKELGRYLQAAFSRPPFGAGRVSVEGLPDAAPENGERWITVDPLDGSLNNKTRGGSMGLPFSACATVLAKSSEAKFSDIIAAGVIDLRNGDLWLAWRDSDGKPRSSLNGNPIVCPQASGPLNLGSMIVIGEMYYPDNRERLNKAFAGTKGWLRNPGSAAYEMALVSSGTAAAYVCATQKQHELGAAYLLTEGAGGVAADFEGNDLCTRTYDFVSQTPVILAANPAIALDIIRRLNR